MPPLVTCTGTAGGFAPSCAALMPTVVVDSAMSGRGCTVNVTANVCGEFAPSLDATATVAWYVPGGSAPVAGCTVIVAGAVVPDTLGAGSQPVGSPAA